MTRVQFKMRSPIMDRLGIQPGPGDFEEYLRGKYGGPGEMGPSPELRRRLNFVSSDDVYETLVSTLVNEDTEWLDVGCGRDIFPSNKAGAAILAERARRLVGVDPDDNIHENELLDENFQGLLEDFRSDRQFDLISMRMVAEHVEDANGCVAKLSELTRKGGLVVIYTPWKWAPMSVAASVIPFSLHNPMKRLLWNTEARDTFPTQYRMNTRKDLRSLFESNGYDCVYFSNVDDCSIFNRYLMLNRLEIGFRNLCYQSGLPYPEYCLLAVYQRL